MCSSDLIGCFAPRYGHQAVAEPGTGRREPGFLVPRAGLAEASCACLLRGGLAALLSSVVRLPSSGWFLPLGAALQCIERLVPVSCAGCPASTSGLSTWWSTTALGETWF